MVAAGGGGLRVVEGLVGLADGLRRGEEAGEGVDDHGEADLLELGGSEEGGLAALDHVGEEGGAAREGAGDGAQLVEGLGGLDEDNVGAGLLVELAAADALVEAEGAASVGAADDDEVAIATGLDGGVELGDLLLGGDDALVLEVAALLRPLLVLEDDAGDARLDALADGADDVEGVAVAGVHIGDEGDVDGADDVAHALHRLGHGQEADVGGSEGGGGEAEACREERLEAGLLGEARGEGVVGARQDDDLGAVEHGAEGGGVVHGASRFSGVRGRYRPAARSVEITAAGPVGVRLRMVVADGFG